MNAVDYLLKPFDSKRVLRTLDKVRRASQAEATRRMPRRRKAARRAGRQGVRRRSQARCAAADGGRSRQPVPQAAAVPAIRQGGGAGAEPPAAGGPERPLLRLDRDGAISVVTKAVEGDSNCRTLEELTDQLDPETVLAGSPLVCGEHPAHPRGGALVQVQLPAAHGRPQADRDPGQPVADQAAERAVQPLARIARISETAWWSSSSVV